jgi:hypothetical protein
MLFLPSRSRAARLDTRTLGYSMRIPVSEDGSRIAVVSQSKVTGNPISTMWIVDEFFKQFVCAPSIP